MSSSQLRVVALLLFSVTELIDLSGPLEIEARTRMTKPSAYAPAEYGGMRDEPHHVGWSRHTDEFLVCTPMGGAVCYRCEFHRTGAEPERVEVGEECEQRPVSERKLEQRLEAGDFRIEDGPWAYGASVVLVVAQKQGKPDSTDLARGVIQIGARLRTPHARVAWLETIAAEAYNEEGLARLRAQEYEQAANYFQRVTDIDPQGWKGPYNLACTHALRGDEDATRRALEEALRRGGGAVRAKALADHDLDAMRERPWFPKP